MDLFNLVASLSLDTSEYEYKLKDIDNSTGSSTDGMSSKWKKFGKVAAAAMAAMAAAAGAAVLKIGKDALTAYADYEQLEGGVKKLYGNMGMSVEEYAKSVNKSVSEVNADWQRNEKAQAIVMENAKKGFQTTGLSANKYMEQATSFSASLINSLNGDTVAAARQTDVAMRAIADNYNTFGGDMQNIQYAFQGFAKQNYTMLDNLKLGYGGTKTEMERLIADANKWAEENGKAADLSIDSFSDVVTAIDYIQQKQGIAGTTAREASTTIAGSVGMVKAAYENLVSGLANPDADVSKLVNDLVSSVGTAAENIMPAIQNMASGLSSALIEITPSIISGIPNAISTALPLLIDSATQMVGVLIETLKTTVPQLLEVGADIIESLVSGIESNGSDFISTGMDMLVDFIEFLTNNIGKFVDLGLRLIKALAQGIIDNIPVFIETLPVIISNLASIINENAPKIISTGMSILMSLIKGIISAIPVLIANIPKILKAFIDVIQAFSWVSLGRYAIKGIAKGIKAAASSIKSAVTKPINSVKNTISDGFSTAKTKAVNFMQGLKDGVKKKIDAAKDAVKKVVEKIKNLFPFNIGKIINLKTPSISMTTGSKKVLGKTITYPKGFSVSWHAKAMEDPYMFNKATIFGAGESGDEMLYGHNALMKDITEAVDNGGRQVVINNTITVNGAEDPEAYMQRFVRSMEIQMRTA